MKTATYDKAKQHLHFETQMLFRCYVKALKDCHSM